jgi:hypothetical protein
MKKTLVCGTAESNRRAKEKGEKGCKSYHVMVPFEYDTQRNWADIG